MPKTVWCAFHDAGQPLVPPVVGDLGIFTATFGALLSLFEPRPKVRSFTPALGTGQCILVLNFNAQHCYFF